MKRKWHIKSHMLVSLIILICAVMLIIVLAFNLSVYGYIRSRVSTQLASVTQSASEERIGNGRGRSESKHFDEHPDKVTGTRGNAVLLDSDGNLASNLHGDDTIAQELSAWFSENLGSGTIENKIISLESGKYAVTAANDPADESQTLLVYVDITSIMAFARQMNLVLALVIVAAVLLCVILSRRFARLFAAPVRSLSDFAEEIGKGNLLTREMRFRDVEFEALAGSMNRMVTDLNESKKKQEIFFQNVSHELRTPLTSIRGNAEGIVYGLMEPQQAAKVILTESDKLSGMVEDILYLSRAGKEKSDETTNRIDLREVFSLCVSEQRIQAEDKGIEFVFDFDENPVLLTISEQDAQRMLGNLLSNAVRYAKKKITLGCRNEPDAVYIYVADDGPGVAEEDLPHVFKRMYKGKGGNHGIGLAIAQTAAESCGGSISVKNDNGAVFEARFPKSAENNTIS